MTDLTDIREEVVAITVNEASAGNYSLDRILCVLDSERLNIKHPRSRKEYLTGFHLLENVTCGTFDVRGYTRFLSKANTSDAKKIVLEFISSFFGDASTRIKESGGVVNKFVGDAVFCYWLDPANKPSPIDVFYEIRRIFYTALANYKRIHEDFEVLFEAEGVNLDISLALSKGEVYYGTFGTDNGIYSDFSLFGDTVNNCFRISKLAFKGQFLADAKSEFLNGYETLKISRVCIRGSDDRVNPFWVIRKKAPPKGILPDAVICTKVNCREGFRYCSKLKNAGSGLNPTKLIGADYFEHFKISCSKIARCSVRDLDSCNSILPCFYAFMNGVDKQKNLRRCSFVEKA
jgi:class 3 adenylate cyclase